MKVNTSTFLAVFLATFLLACGGGTGADNDSVDPLESSPQTDSEKTIFGLGGTSGIASSGAIQLLVDQVSGVDIDRDISQIAPNSSELHVLFSADNSATQYAVSSGAYVISFDNLVNIVGVKANFNFWVESDFRTNIVASNIGGGYTGHSYVALDGKFIDMLNEIANYQAMFETSATFDSFFSAVDKVVWYHNSGIGSFLECCYPLANLTQEQREISDRYFFSMMGALLYHEFAHYYLYHMLDRVRGQLDPSGLVLYSSANEDDADFLAGVLTAKAGLDPIAAQLLFDLMVYYMGQRLGFYLSFSQVTSSAFVQFLNTSPNYSALATRKQNFLNGYNSY